MHGEFVTPATAEEVADELSKLPREEVLRIITGLEEEMAAAADAMEAFLGFLSPAVGHSKLLLIAPPPFQYGDWVTEERQIEGSRKLPDVYAALAARLGIGFADAGEWNIALTFDGVHFTPEGHAAFAEGLRSVLDAL